MKEVEAYLSGFQEFGNVKRVGVAAGPSESNLEDEVQLGECVAGGDAKKASDDGVVAIG